MDPNQPVAFPAAGEETRPALETYEAVAGLIESHLTAPNLTEAEVSDGLWLARDLKIASVVVRPCDVDLAVRLLDGSGVAVASVAGFPHGSSNTATKLYEGRDLLRRGAREIGIVVNFGKMFSRQFQHIETEILQMSESCHQAGGMLKVIFENGYLATDLKVILCRISKRCEADIAETGTGFGPTGYTMEDLALMKSILKDRAAMKATGVATLDETFAVYNAGCDRAGTTAPAAILEPWKQILAEREAAKKQQAQAS